MTYLILGCYGHQSSIFRKIELVHPKDVYKKSKHVSKISSDPNFFSIILLVWTWKINPNLLRANFNV